MNLLPEADWGYGTNDVDSYFGRRVAESLAMLMGPLGRQKGSDLLLLARAYISSHLLLNVWLDEMALIVFQQISMTSVTAERIVTCQIKDWHWGIQRQCFSWPGVTLIFLLENPSLNPFLLPFWASLCQSPMVGHTFWLVVNCSWLRRFAYSCPLRVGACSDRSALYLCWLTPRLQGLRKKGLLELGRRIQH